MNANCVVMFTIRQWVIRMEASLRERNSKIFRTTGNARYAEHPKTTSKRCKNRERRGKLPSFFDVKNLMHLRIQINSVLIFLSFIVCNQHFFGNTFSIFPVIVAIGITFLKIITVISLFLDPFLQNVIFLIFAFQDIGQRK